MKTPNGNDKVKRAVDKQGVPNALGENILIFRPKIEHSPYLGKEPEDRDPPDGAA